MAAQLALEHGPAALVHAVVDDRPALACQRRPVVRQLRRADEHVGSVHAVPEAGLAHDGQAPVDRGARTGSVQQALRTPPQPTSGSGAHEDRDGRVGFIHDGWRLWHRRPHGAA